MEDHQKDNWIDLGHGAYRKANPKRGLSDQSGGKVRKKRPRRSADASRTATMAIDKNNANSGILRRTDSASTLLGLSILLFPDRQQYGGVVLNNFYGFRVSLILSLSCSIYFSLRLIEAFRYIF